MTTESTPDWRLHGVRIVRSDELDLNTPQTPGMTRAAAITHASAGANKLWAGTVTIHPNAKTGPHHHGKLESVIYVINPSCPLQTLNGEGQHEADDLQLEALWRNRMDLPRK